MSENHNYLVCCGRPWAWRAWRRIKQLPGQWRAIGIADSLPVELALWSPRYLFFLFWSDKVPVKVVENHECIGFHMTQLPYGRGGSPLQNLIAEGKTNTEVTAFRLAEGLDVGPVYCKLPMSLDGLAEEIYLRAANICAEQIEYIVANEPMPAPQQGGEIRLFHRRTPDQSEIPYCESLDRMFDHLRMLDADAYPRAYLDHAGYRYTFSRPARRDGRIEADVKIEPWKQERE